MDVALSATALGGGAPVALTASSAYREALDYLFVRTTGKWRLGLERMERLLDAIGRPHADLRAFHVGGTNGKGSVCATLDALLRGRPEGWHVGVYSSPHLVDFRERIRIDGVPITEEAVVDWIARRAELVERGHATFFEATTAMAFEWFAEAGVDVAIIEVGLGGRLDATNVVRPLAAGIASIGIDHVEYLGHTREAIAAEKAGIFKAGRSAVIGERDHTIAMLLARLAHDAGASPVRLVTEEYVTSDVRVGGSPSDGRGGTSFTLTGSTGTARLWTPLAGTHQAANTALALAMLDSAGAPYALPLGDAAAALERVRLPGRFQRHGRYIFDVAHNPDGAAVLAETLRAVRPPGPVVALLTVLADKDWRGIIDRLAPEVSHLVLTTAPTAPAGREWDPATAAHYVAERGWSADVVLDFDAALARAAAEGATVLITGSFHTVGDAMARLQLSPLAG